MPRPRDPPLPDDVFDHMAINRCYVVADLVAEFAEHDPTRGTIRNRLEELVDDDLIERQKHENGTVTYRRPGEIE